MSYLYLYPHSQYNPGRKADGIPHSLTHWVNIYPGRRWDRPCPERWKKTPKLYFGAYDLARKYEINAFLKSDLHYNFNEGNQPRNIWWRAMTFNLNILFLWTHTLAKGISPKLKKWAASTDREFGSAYSEALQTPQPVCTVQETLRPRTGPSKQAWGWIPFRWRPYFWSYEEG